MPHIREIRILPSDRENTSRIQAAIDAAADGPVRVVLTAGRHESAGLRLRSDVTLHLEDGAELRFRPDYGAYAQTEVDVEAEQSNRAMIVAKGAERIALTGAGRIACEGSRNFSRGMDAEMGTLIPQQKRPRVLVLDSCKEVTLDGITVDDSPMWTLHLVDCSDVAIRNVTVRNNRQMPNTDGIVIDACQNVSITRCDISTADDGIVLKTSQRLSGAIAGECADIRVADCRVESNSCALKLGTESFGPFRNIVFEDCEISDSNRGLGVFSRDGGAFSALRFSRIRLDCLETPHGFWGSGEALTINVLDRRPDLRPAGPVQGVTVEDISGRMEGAINLVAERPGGIADISLERITLTQAPGPLGTALAYDLRPTPADLAPAPEAAGRMNAWRLGPDGRVVGLVDYPGGMPALFAQNVTGLHIGDITITRPDPLPEGWNPAALVESSAEGPEAP